MLPQSSGDYLFAVYNNPLSVPYSIYEVYRPRPRTKFQRCLCIQKDSPCYHELVHKYHNNLVVCGLIRTSNSHRREKQRKVDLAAKRSHKRFARKVLLSNLSLRSLQGYFMPALSACLGQNGRRTSRTVGSAIVLTAARNSGG